MKPTFALVKITVLASVTLLTFCLMGLHTSGTGPSSESAVAGSRQDSQMSPRFAIDMWGERRDLSSSWLLFDFVHAAGCGYCVLNAHEYQENFAEALAPAGVQTFGVDVFEEQRDLIDYVKHNRILFPILTEPDALWAKLRCPGLPGQSLFHNGRLLFSESETLTFRNYDRFREELRATGAQRVRNFRPAGPLKKAVNCIYEDERALLIVGDDVEPEAKTFLPGLKRVVFRTKRASEVTESDLGAGSVFVIGTPYDNRFLARLGDKIPFAVQSDRIAFADTTLVGKDLMLWYCHPNPWNPETYLVVYTGTIDSQKGWGVFDGSQDFVLARHEKDTDAIPIAHGIFVKKDAEWSLPARAIIWDNKRPHHPAVAVAACGSEGCESPVPGGVTSLPTTRRTNVVTSSDAIAVQTETKTLASGRFPALSAADDSTCWVAWDHPGQGIFAGLLSDGGISPRQIWAGGHSNVVGTEAVGVSKLNGTVLGTEVDAYKPSLLADQAQGCWLAWSERSEEYYQVYAASVPAFGTAKLWQISHRSNLDHHDPALARGADGTVWLTWYAWQANSRRPYFRSWNGQQWSTVAGVPTYDRSQFAWYLSGATGHSSAHFAWMQHYPTLTSIVAAEATREGFGEPILLAEAGRYPSIAFNPVTQETRVVWQQWMMDQSDNDRYEWRIFTSINRDGRWSDAMQIPDCPSGRNATPVVTVDGLGQTWVFWCHKDHPTDDEFATPERRGWQILCSVLTTKGWRGPLTVSDPLTDARSPAAASSGRSVWVSWHQGRGAQLQIVVNRMGTVQHFGDENVRKTWPTTEATSN
ncbi:MAG: hypothetical protein OEN01_02200 [Candidatus Krumholzibacteria bacterium]|nr:hypothetical protein [Candidatus Krumholzibacteria bacterium]